MMSGHGTGKKDACGQWTGKIKRTMMGQVKSEKDAVDITILFLLLLLLPCSRLPGSRC